jgi:tRNA modification GTPase
MDNTETDTIVALATAPGRGGIAIVRISGPKVQEIAIALVGHLPKPRYAHLATFKDNLQQVIDQGLVLYFPSPYSFTGEDILELHGHGGPAVVDILIRQIVKLGARLARPGEFSERAFLNDKIDLAQAEAIADLIDASSELAVRSALRSLQGEFSIQINELVNSLIHLRMYVEAAIDFAEEEIDFLADNQVANNLDSAIKKLEKITTNAAQGSLLRDGIKAVIVGEPNVGKSSLLNRLSGTDIAIVTDIPGTTRDVLRQEINLDGMPIHIIDTAGLRESSDIVEQEGIRRAYQEITQADIIIWVTDASAATDVSPNLLQAPARAARIEVRNKIDLTQEQASIQVQAGKTLISLSAKNNIGLDLLKNHIKTSVGYAANAEGTFSARRRHLDALARAKTFLLNGQQQLHTHKAGELLAEDLRHAQLALSEITGEFTADDLLGKIFSSFCIGK